MKAWLKRQIAELTELQQHPEPDQGVFEGCAYVVREAADRAAKAGLIDLYEHYKNERFCTARDAVAILNSILAALQPAPDGDGPLTVKQAARRLTVSEKTIRRMVDAGELPHRRVGRSIRILADDLDRFIRDSSQKARRPDRGQYRHLDI